LNPLLRRTYDLAVSNNEITVKDCKLVVDEATLYHQDESVQLSFTELQILNMLFRNEGKYVTIKFSDSQHFSINAVRLTYLPSLRNNIFKICNSVKDN
jgi:hypothetical protein